MGLLFHHDTLGKTPEERWTEASADRHAIALREAIAAQLQGDELSPGLFTDDVVVTTPHATIQSLRELDVVCRDAEDALTNTVLTFRFLSVEGDLACAEWRLEASLTGPLLVEDDQLVEPTGTRVHLGGATFAEFRGGRICRMRHYFDRGEILDRLLPSSSRYR